MTHKAAAYLLRNSKILYIYVLKQLENELQQLRHLTRVRLEHVGTAHSQILTKILQSKKKKTDTRAALGAFLL